MHHHIFPTWLKYGSFLNLPQHYVFRRFIRAAQASYKVLNSDPSIFATMETWNLIVLLIHNLCSRLSLKWSF